MSELVGRYLKALINNPDGGGSVKAGEYGLIRSNDLYNVDFPNHKNYCATGALRQPKKYELMPIGFDPNKTSYPYKVVITNTQEEWDFVISKCSPSSTLYTLSKSFESFKKQYPEGIAVCIKDAAYCGIDWYKKQGALIYSFEEWCKLNNYTLRSTWIPKIGDVLTLIGVKTDPVVTITAVLEDGMDGCKWVKFTPDTNYGGRFRVNLKSLPNTNGYYLGKDFTLGSDGKTITPWIPQVGEYAIMEEAGGWGFSPQNNGSLAIITKVGASRDGKEYPISGNLVKDNTLFTDVPIRSDRYPGRIICRKALPHEISTDITKEVEELIHFPSEGCVYDSISNLELLTKYLTARPNSRSDGTTKKEEAIGVAWNSTSQWWLKTTKSEKPAYKISQLNKFISKRVMEYKFKVGDTVKAIAQSGGWGAVKLGDIGIIRQLPNSIGSHYTADFPNQKFWSGVERCFELVKSVNEFTLPASWYITVTEENKAALTKWRGYNLTVGYITGMYDWGRRIAKEHNARYDGKGWGIEITFDQFKKYVLEESNLQETAAYNSFFLPDKWFVRATKENEQVLRDWRKGDHTGWENDLVMLSIKNWNDVKNAIRDGYMEITYQQFQQHILNLSIVDIIVSKYPYGITLEKNTDYNVIKKPTDITIPRINSVAIKVDFNISTKLMDIRLPNFNVTPEQVKPLKVEKFTVSL